MAAATVLAKIASVATNFGWSDELEACLLAAVVPGLLINLISESMNQALIPTLVRVRERESREGAQRLLSNCLVGGCLLLIGVSVMMGLSARRLLPACGSHFTTAKIDFAVRLSYRLLPVLLFTGMASIFTGVLNLVSDFAIPALAPIVTSIA